MAEQKSVFPSADDFMMEIKNSSTPEETEGGADEETSAGDQTSDDDISSSSEGEEIEDADEAQGAEASESDNSDEEEEGSDDSDEDESSEEDGSIDDWFDEEDGSSDDESIDFEAETSLDFDQVSKALGKEVKTASDLLQAVDQMKQELQTARTRVSEEGLPEELVEAIKIARNGGDYLAYLNVEDVNYSSLSNAEAYAASVAHIFSDDEGNIDQDALQKHIDSMSDDQLDFEGRKAKREHVARQQQAKESRARQEAAKRQEQEYALKKVLSSTDEISGFKLNQSHKSDIFSTITQGKLMNELFLDKDGNPDPQKAVNTYFKAKYFDKVKKYYEQRVSNDTKKKMLDKMTNSNVKKGSQSLPKPEKKEEGLDFYLNQLKQQ